jgi:hypothetical protein
MEQDGFFWIEESDTSFSQRFVLPNQSAFHVLYFTILEAMFALHGNRNSCITKWLILVMYLKNTGRNSTFRAKFFRREISSSSRSLSTNSQTKGLRSKRRISLVFSTHFHSYQPGFAIIATNNLHWEVRPFKINSHIQNYNHSPVTSPFS